MDGDNNIEDGENNNSGVNRGFYNIGPKINPEKSGNSKTSAPGINALKKGEEGAADNLNQPGAGAKATSMAEGMPKANHINNVIGENEGKRTKGKLGGAIKKSAPVAVIVGSLAIFIGFAFGSHSMLAVSLIERGGALFNSINVSTALRTKYFLKFQTNGEVKSCIKSTAFGSKFKLTSKQKTKLSGEGIEEVEINGKTYLAFDDGSSHRSLIAPDSKAASKVNVDSDINGEKFLKVMTFEDAYSKITDFRYSYNKASRTWKGSVGAWFDSLAYGYLDRVDASRNRFSDWAEKKKEKIAERQAERDRGNRKSGQIENEMEAEKELTKETLRKGKAEEAHFKTKIEETEEDTDSEGNPTTKTTTTDVDETFKTNMTAEELKEKVDSIKGKLGKAQAGTSILCAVSGFIGGLSLTVGALEAIQILKVGFGYGEAVDKMKDGKGTDTPLHILSGALVTPKKDVQFKLADDGTLEATKSNFLDMSTEQQEAYANQTDLVEETSDTEGIAMQASTVVAAYQGTHVDQSDPSLQPFNISNSFKKVLTWFGVGAGAFVTCAAAQLAVNAASVIVSLAGTIFGIATGGIGKVVTEALKSAGKTVAKLAKGAAIGAAIAIAIKVLLPLLAQIVTRDHISDLAGIPLGHVLMDAFSQMHSGNARTRGQSLTTESGLIEYTVKQHQVLADEAEYERANRSPFDITSEHTFLGSLLTKFASFYTTSYSTSGIFTTLGNITRNSLVSLLPTASAVDAAEKTKDIGECPYLESIGAVGDVFCNPYIITDVDSPTMSTHPADIINTIDTKYHGFEDDEGNPAPTIKTDSNLGKYIIACSQRDSSFGAADQNIANSFANTGTITVGKDNVVGTGLDGLLNGVVNVTTVGDIIDVVQNGEKLANVGWITGASCVADNHYREEVENVQAGLASKMKIADWEEVQYYQRFLEDQALMESMDPDYKSAETAFLEKYYAEHPLDNSYEGVIARFSGLTKDNVVAILDVVDYINYIANYDPSTRYVFTNEEKDYTKKTYIDTENNVAIDAENIIVEHVIVYNDIRNRTATV